MWLCWVTGRLLLVHENLNISLRNNDVKHRWLSAGRSFLWPHTAEQRGPGNRPISWSEPLRRPCPNPGEWGSFAQVQGRKGFTFRFCPVGSSKWRQCDCAGWGWASVPSAIIRCPRWEGRALCCSPPWGWTRAIRPQAQFRRELPFSFLRSEPVWALRCSKDMGLSSQRARRRWDGWVAIRFPNLLPSSFPSNWGCRGVLTQVSEAWGQGGQAGLEAFHHLLLGWEDSGAGLRADTGILHGCHSAEGHEAGLVLSDGQWSR